MSTYSDFIKAATFFVGIFILFLDGYIIDGFLQEFSSIMNISVPKASYLISLYSLSMALFPPIALFSLSKYSKKTIILFCMLFFSIFNFLITFSENFYFILLMRIISALYAGIALGVIFSLLNEVFTEDRGSKFIGIALTAAPMSIMIGIPLGIHLFKLAGWKTVFYFIGCTSLVYTIMLHFFIPKNVEEKKSKVIEKLTHIPKGVISIISSNAFFVMGSFIMMIYFSVYTLNILHISIEERKILFLLAGFFGLLGCISSGYLLERYSSFKTLQLGILIFMLSMFLFFVSSLINSGKFVVLVSSSLWGFSCFFVIPAYQAVLFELTSDSSEDSFWFTLNNSMSCASAIISSALGGFIITKLDNSLLPIFSAFLGAISFICLKAIKTKRRENTHPNIDFRYQ